MSLLEAVRKGAVKAVRRALKHNLSIADVEESMWVATNRGFLNVLQILTDCPGVNVNMFSQNGETLISSAVVREHVEIVRFLLTLADVDPNLAFFNGKTPFMKVLEGEKSGEMMEMVRAFAAHPLVDPNDAFGIAVWRGFADVVAVLIHHPRLKINGPTIFGDPLLFTACRLGRTEVVRLLLQRADLNVMQRTSKKTCAVLIAGSKGNTDILRMLLDDVRVDVTVVGRHGRTALIRAAHFGHADATRMLLDDGRIDVNHAMTAGDGGTALCCAAEQDHVSVLGILLGDPRVSSSNRRLDGRTALSLCTSDDAKAPFRRRLSQRFFDTAVGLATMDLPILQLVLIFSWQMGNEGLVGVLPRLFVLWEWAKVVKFRHLRVSKNHC